MIEINLLPGKKKKAAPGAGFKLALPDFQGLLASIKNPWLLVASAASVIVIGGGLLWFITQSTRLRVLEGRLTDVQAEKRRFDAVIAQKRQSERIRDSLVGEIGVIRGIDADRYIWPHILDQVTKALPPGLPVVGRRDASDDLHGHRGRPTGDGLQRRGPLSGGRLRVHPDGPPDPVGEVAPWPCCLKTGRAR